MAGVTGAPRVTVIFGGPSAEHDVSIVSGTAIAEALLDAGGQVDQLYLTLDRRCWALPADHRRAGRPVAIYDDPPALGATGPRSVLEAVDALGSAPDGPVPAFVALHGPFGEDGTIQALLEAAGVPYTGSGVAASALGMDKALFKRMCRGLGLPVVDWREIRADRWARDRAAVHGELVAFAAGTGDPRLMIKPARLGSSVGMTLAHSDAELDGALDHAFRYDDLALAEAYLADARDLVVSVIGNDPAALEIHGPGEIVSGHEFYDYDAKYVPGLSETSTHAEVSDLQRTTLHKLSRDVYRAIGAEGFARIDFLVAGERIVVSEINTIPGFTPISLFPTMPSAAGYTFVDVVRRLIDLALERHAARPAVALRTEDLPR
jgi:D-alanine-D-alanine ligase